MNRWTIAVLVASLATAVQASDIKGKWDIMAGAGISKVEDDGNLKGTVYTELGYGVTKQAQIFGDYTYVNSSRDFGHATVHVNSFGMGFRVSPFPKAKKFEPFFTVVGSGAHIWAKGGGTAVLGGGTINGSFGETDGAFSAGAGLRLYMRDNFGVIPEYRWTRIFFNEKGEDNPNIHGFTVGFFYRFGGKK